MQQDEKSQDSVRIRNISLPGLLITAISGFCRPQDRVASWDGHNGGSPWLKGLIMTNAAVTASPRVRGILKRISRSQCSFAATPRTLNGSDAFAYARNASSHDRCIRHGIQRIVCSSISINSICFRILAYNSIGRLDNRRAMESFVRKCRRSLRICPSFCSIHLQTWKKIIYYHCRERALENMKHESSMIIRNTKSIESPKR